MLDKEKLQSSNVKNLFSLTQISHIVVQYKADNSLADQLSKARGSFGAITSVSSDTIPVFDSNAFNASPLYDSKIFLNYAFRASDIALLPEVTEVVPYNSTLAALKQDLSNRKFGDNEEYQSHVWILGVLTDNGGFNYWAEFKVTTGMVTPIGFVEQITTGFSDGSKRRWVVYNSNDTSLDPIEAEKTDLFGNGFTINIDQTAVTSMID